MLIFSFPLFERLGEEPTLPGVWRRQVEEETSKQSLVHLLNRHLETVFWRGFELLHILAAVLMLPLPFLHWWLCKVLKREVMEDEALDLRPSVKALSGSSNRRRIFLVSFVFCQMACKFHMLIPFGAMVWVCWILSSGITYEKCCSDAFFQSNAEILEAAYY